MSVLHSAEIIPFPVRARVVAPIPSEAAEPAADPVLPDPADRLKRALAQLEAALAEQRVAVTAWRGAIADLGGSVSGLGNSLNTLNGRLENLKAQTRP